MKFQSGQKLIITLAGFLLINSCVLAQASIHCHVSYANAAQTPIHDSALVQLYQSGVLITGIPPDSNGDVVFDALPAGDYTLKVSVTKKSGGYNAMDSYLIVRHFVGMTPALTGINLVAADVNGSGGIPGSADELAIVRRFIHMIPSFMPPNVPPPGRPDWVSETHTVILTDGTTETVNIRVLCTGDVNGSFTPY
ncbi:MAG TPA: hypothetical protein P5531_04420 [Bacteroidales bacterium]|nr:hypothetical protein [Bacteroidales bacterium]HSA42752.1 hypothetical protein [Bacteroidales bacterium]